MTYIEKILKFFTRACFGLVLLEVCRVHCHLEECGSLYIVLEGTTKITGGFFLLGRQNLILSYVNERDC